MRAALGPRDKIFPLPTEPICSTSQCHWETFNSLGVCVSLHNVTKDLKIEEVGDGLGQRRATLSNETYLNVLPHKDREQYLSGASLAATFSASRDPTRGAFRNETHLLGAGIGDLELIVFELDNWDTAKFHALRIIGTFAFKVKTGA